MVTGQNVTTARCSVEGAAVEVTLTRQDAERMTRILRMSQDADPSLVLSRALAAYEQYLHRKARLMRQARNEEPPSARIPSPPTSDAYALRRT